MITQTQLKERLNYDPSTGVFTWKEYPSFNKRWKAGDIAGTKTVDGYIRIKIDSKQLAAHRLAWLYTHGTEPAVYLDHINRDKTDNRLCNLRPAGYRENSENRSISKNNKSGYMGVSWASLAGKWKAGIKHKGKSHNLGFFDSPEEAAEAYVTAKKLLHTF